VRAYRDAGDIGRPVLIRLRLGMGPAWGGWRDSPARSGGGLLSDAGVHRLYLALFFFGPVRDVHAVLDVPRQRGETFAVAVLEFASGALSIIEANHHGPRGTFDDEIEIVGSDAILRLGGIESLSFGYRSGAALSMSRDGRWTEVAVDGDDWQRRGLPRRRDHRPAAAGDLDLRPGARDVRALPRGSETVGVAAGLDTMRRGASAQAVGLDPCMVPPVSSAMA
jgi:predicted dehydrogenase